MSEDRSGYLELLQDVLQTDGPVYDVARKVWRMSMVRMRESWIYHPSWLLWGALTDWVENKPEQTERAEAAMREAAQEFLQCDGIEAAERAYFDRWLYERMGYARPDSAR